MAFRYAQEEFFNQIFTEVRKTELHNWHCCKLGEVEEGVEAPANGHAPAIYRSFSLHLQLFTASFYFKGL